MSLLSWIHGARSKGRSKPFRRQRSIIRTSSAICAGIALGGLSIGLAFAATQPATDNIPRLGIEKRSSAPKRLVALASETPAAAPPVEQAKTPPAGTQDVLDQLHPVATLPAPKVKGGFPRGLHPVIKHSMVEASRYLPEGWQLEFMNALRDTPGVWNGPHGKRDHTGGALAVDVWLVNPQGQRLCNYKCAQNFDDYRRFMEMVKFIQDRDFPAYRRQGRWGGYFSGSYANDEMHYDLEPSDRTAAGNWEKGLHPGFAHFAKKGDVGKGMGQIASYRLPNLAPGAIALAKAPPVDLMAPLAVPQRTAARPVAAPVVQARAKWQKPQRYAQKRARTARWARTYRDADDD